MALFETHCFGISLPSKLETNRREALKRFNCFWTVIHRPRRKCYMENAEKNRASDEIGGINSSNDQIGADMSEPEKIPDMPTDEDYMAALGPCGK